VDSIGDRLDNTCEADKPAHRMRGGAPWMRGPRYEGKVVFKTRRDFQKCQRRQRNAPNHNHAGPVTKHFYDVWRSCPASLLAAVGGSRLQARLLSLEFAQAAAPAETAAEDRLNDQACDNSPLRKQGSDQPWIILPDPIFYCSSWFRKHSIFFPDVC